MHDRLLTGLAGHATASRGGFTADSRIPLRSSMKRQREEGCGSRFHPSLMDSRDKSSHTSTMGSGLSSLPYRMHMRVLCTWHGQGHTRVHTHWHTHWHTHAPREGSEEGNGHPNVYGQAARGRSGSSRPRPTGTGGGQPGISASETETAQTAEHVGGRAAECSLRSRGVQHGSALPARTHEALGSGGGHGSALWVCELRRSASHRELASGRM